MIKLVSIFIALVTSVGVAAGMLVGAANAAAPGDALYGLDRGVESLQLQLTFDTQSLQDLQAQLAQERLDEVQDLAQRGDQLHLDQALQELESALLEASGVDPVLDAQDEGDPADDLSGYCDGAATKNHPVGEKLAGQTGAPYEEIMDWFCQGHGFGNIKLAYGIATAAGVDVGEVFDQFANGLGWGEISQLYGLKDGDPTDGEEGEEDGGSEEEEPPGTEGFKQPKGGTFCGGSAGKNHPTGDKLASEFGVDYEEIIGWFCKGYGFGEIKLAYTIAAATGVSVQDIFTQRGNGNGWGNIMKENGYKNGKPPKSLEVKPNNGKSNNDKGNSGKGNNGKGNNGKPKNKP